MTRPDLSIIIVARRPSDAVRELLASIAAETRRARYEIILVDNGSRAGLESVVADFQALRPESALACLTNPKPIGSAAAANLGLVKSQGRIIAILYPDTIVQDGAMDKMVDWFDAHPDVGVAGPMIVNPDGSVQPSVKRLPMLLDQALILVRIHKVAPWLPPLTHHLARDFDYSRDSEVGQVIGGAFFLRREAFEKVGLFDERFLAWFEEVDYCKRAVEAGFKVMYTPAARITHRVGASLPFRDALKSHGRLAEGAFQYFRKHHGLMDALGLAALLVTMLFLPVFVSVPVVILISLWKYRASRK
jgi:hypothetical protein